MWVTTITLRDESHIRPHTYIQGSGVVNVCCCFNYLQFFFTSAFLVQSHTFFMLFEILSFGCLQIEPGVRERLDVRQQGLDEWMKFILITKGHNYYYIL